MGFKSDIEIAQECEMLPITEIAEKAGIDDKYLEQYGKYKAKIDYNLLKESDKKDGKLILMTAINPTPAGEGKTTTTVGLADAMQKLGKSVTTKYWVLLVAELHKFWQLRCCSLRENNYHSTDIPDFTAIFMSKFPCIFILHRHRSPISEY